MPARVQSPSSINTFKQCKRKYYYQYIEKIPTLSNIHQVRGNIAHSTLEDFFDIDISDCTPENCTPKLVGKMQAIFLNCWNRYKPKLDELNLSKDRERFYFEETMLMLMNWNKQFIENLTKTISEKQMTLQEAFHYLTPIREQEFRSEAFSVRGFIDAIQHLENEVHIIDYKTNSKFDMKESILLQLGIYSLLYKEKHGVLPTKVGIYFLRHKLKMMNVDEQLLEMAEREIKFIHEHTDSTTEMTDYPQTITGLCKWSTGQCDFYETCKPHD
jgi:RecB family exonuclease